MLLAASIAVIAIAAAASLWMPGRTPSGQPPLLSLNSPEVSNLIAAFDAPPASPRLLLLVSPT